MLAHYAVGFASRDSVTNVDQKCIRRERLR